VDALTRRSQDIPKQEDNMDVVVLPPHRFIEVNEVTIKQPEDPLAKELGEILQYKGNLIMVPDDQKLWKKIITNYHDGTAYVHPGVRATEERIKRHYYWAGMIKDVEDYIAKCPLCQ
jgi:Integrase zinc binding domain